MPMDWKTKESYQRLLAAMVASLPKDMKLDYRRIAIMYGMGATYDSIEGRFRIIKKDAAALINEVDNGDRPPPPPRGNGNGAKPATPNSTPRKPKATAGDPKVSGRKKGGVAGARVEKTPTKKSKTPTLALDVDVDSDDVVIKREPDAHSSSTPATSSVPTPIFNEENPQTPGTGHDGSSGHHHHELPVTDDESGSCFVSSDATNTHHLDGYMSHPGDFGSVVDTPMSYPPIIGNGAGGSHYPHPDHPDASFGSHPVNSFADDDLYSFSGQHGYAGYDPYDDRPM